MSKSKKDVPFPNDYKSHKRTSYDKPYKDSKDKVDGSGYEEFTGPPIRKDESNKPKVHKKGSRQKPD